MGKAEKGLWLTLKTTVMDTAKLLTSLLAWAFYKLPLFFLKTEEKKNSWADGSSTQHHLSVQGTCCPPCSQAASGSSFGEEDGVLILSKLQSQPVILSLFFKQWTSRDSLTPPKLSIYAKTFHTEEKNKPTAKTKTILKKLNKKSSLSKRGMKRIFTFYFIYLKCNIWFL